MQYRGQCVSLRTAGRFKQADQGERHFALLQVGAERFSDHLIISPQVQHVIGDLERDPNRVAVLAQRLHRVAVRTCMSRPEHAGNLAQFRSLPPNHLQISLLIEFEHVAVHQLPHLSLADPTSGLADPATGFGRIEGRRQTKALGKQVIAQQNAEVVTPLGVDGLDMTAKVRTVQDIVMDQCRCVYHLDNRPQYNVLLVDLADGRP